jgi:uncharacterized protein YbjT (DUF2867 family)
MILVTGATGTSGSEIVKSLSKAGVAFRAMVRDPGKAEALRLPGVHIVRGDFADGPSLDAALVGVDRVLLLTPPAQDQVAVQGRFIAAAVKTKVKHIVKFSAIRADAKSPYAFPRWHGESEQQLEQSGIAWTHLRPNFFMQNLFGLAASIKSGAIYQPAADSKAAFVDVRDIADVAAKALTQTGHEGRAYDLTGPQSLTYHDVAQIFSTVLGRPIQYVPVSSEAAGQAMKGSGMPAWQADAINELMTLMREGKTADVTLAVPELTGHPAKTLESFVRENVASFKQ